MQAIRAEGHRDQSLLRRPALEEVHSEVDERSTPGDLHEHHHRDEENPFKASLRYLCDRPRRHLCSPFKNQDVEPIFPKAPPGLMVCRKPPIATSRSAGFSVHPLSRTTTLPCLIADGPRRTISVVPRKGWIPTRRDRSSAPEPPDGLAETRLALVHRYMTDGEVVPPQPRRPSQPEAAPDTSEQSRESTAGRHSSAPETPDEPAGDRLPPLARSVTNEEPGPVGPRRPVQPEEPPDTTEQSRESSATVRDPERRATVRVDHGADDEVRRRKAIAKADRRAMKQAARQMAALEKKEARERKALAKAAARRRSA